jgi:AAT family amino acid transporter
LHDNSYDHHSDLGVAGRDEGDAMTAQDRVHDAQTGELSEPARVPLAGPLTPYVTTIAIFVLSIVSWWLLGDAKWSIIGAEAPVVSCVLFWTILGFIFTGFTFGNWPFSTLPQPLSGVVQVVVNVAIGFVMTFVFTRVIGSWDPTFSADAPGGVGYTASAFIVLIGFYAYTLAAANWGGYPFENVAAPLASVAQFFLAAFITVVGVVLIVYPNFNGQLAPNAPISLVDGLGWVYSSIVIAIVCAMQWQNHPWAAVSNRHLRALAALVVTLGGGYLLAQALEVVVTALAPEGIKSMATFASAAETAQLGVCISLWSLILGLILAPVAAETKLAARGLRTVVVLVLAVVTYLVFTRFFATTVLHFPAVSGDYGGDALAFIDWTILIVLWHAVAFGGHLSTRRALVGARGR